MRGGSNLKKRRGGPNFRKRATRARKKKIRDENRRRRLDLFGLLMMNADNNSPHQIRMKGKPLGERLLYEHIRKQASRPRGDLDRGVNDNGLEYPLTCEYIRLSYVSPNVEDPHEILGACALSGDNGMEDKIVCRGPFPMGDTTGCPHYRLWHRWNSDRLNDAYVINEKNHSKLCSIRWRGREVLFKLHFGRDGGEFSPVDHVHVMGFCDNTYFADGDYRNRTSMPIRLRRRFANYLRGKERDVAKAVYNREMIDLRATCSPRGLSPLEGEAATIAHSTELTKIYNVFGDKGTLSKRMHFKK